MHVRTTRPTAAINPVSYLGAAIETGGAVSKGIEFRECVGFAGSTPQERSVTDEADIPARAADWKMHYRS